MQCLSTCRNNYIVPGGCVDIHGCDDCLPFLALDWSRLRGGVIFQEAVETCRGCHGCVICFSLRETTRDIDL